MSQQEINNNNISSTVMILETGFQRGEMLIHTQLLIPESEQTIRLKANIFWCLDVEGYDPAGSR